MKNNNDSLHHSFLASAATASTRRFAQSQNITLDQLEQALNEPEVNHDRAVTQRLAKFRASSLADEALVLALATITGICADYNHQRAADHDDQATNYIAPDDPSIIKPETARKAAALLCRLTGATPPPPGGTALRAVSSPPPPPSPSETGVPPVISPTSPAGRGRFINDESGEGLASSSHSTAPDLRSQDRVLAPAARKDSIPDAASEHRQASDEKGRINPATTNNAPCPRLQTGVGMPPTSHISLMSNARALLMPDARSLMPCYTRSLVPCYTRSLMPSRARPPPLPLHSSP